MKGVFQSITLGVRQGGPENIGGWQIISAKMAEFSEQIDPTDREFCPAGVRLQAPTCLVLDIT